MCRRDPLGSSRSLIAASGVDPMLRTFTARHIATQVPAAAVTASRTRSQDSDHADWTQGPQNEMICVPSPAHPTHLQAAPNRQLGNVQPGGACSRRVIGPGRG